MKPKSMKNQPSSKELVLVAVDAVIEKKGGDLAVLDLTGISSIADYFLICSGSNSRQVRTIAEEVDSKVKEIFGLSPKSTEGLGDAMWVLMDYVDFVVHIFMPETRDFYSLERLWADAGRLEVGAPV